MSFRTWGPVALLVVAGTWVAVSLRARPVPVSANGSAPKAGDGLKMPPMEADTSHLADHHLWITIHLPAEPGKPARTVRFDAYRQVLTHYGDPRKIPSKFTVAPASPHAGSGV